jgi:hypothetical protein
MKIRMGFLGQKYQAKKLHNGVKMMKITKSFRKKYFRLDGFFSFSGFEEVAVLTLIYSGILNSIEFFLM